MSVKGVGSEPKKYHTTMVKWGITLSISELQLQTDRTSGPTLIVGHNLTEMPLEELVAKTRPTLTRWDKTTPEETELSPHVDGPHSTVEPPQSTPLSVPEPVLSPGEDDSIHPATDQSTATPEDRREPADVSSKLHGHSDTTLG